MTKRRVAEPTAEYIGRRKPTNLSLDAEAIARGEAWARAQDLSLSQVVSALLQALPSPGEPLAHAGLTDVVRRLYGIAASAEGRDAYHQYLVRKYDSPT